MNVIGDIAGQYDALMALLRKMPDQETLSVGDMIDRGPKSREVVEWFMKHGRALLGNHEHMMADWYYEWQIYAPGIWEMNGGYATKVQYEGDLTALAEVADWVVGLPIYWENEYFVVSHAFLPDGPDTDVAKIWNRKEPIVREKLQIAGHNSQFGLRMWVAQMFDTRVYAMCIDTSASNMLCGVDLNTMRVYTQEYI